MTKTLGQKIKALRKSKNIIQVDMATQLNISRPTYNNIETGKISVSFARLDSIAKVLDTTIAELLNESEDKPASPVNQDLLKIVCAVAVQSYNAVMVMGKEENISKVNTAIVKASKDLLSKLKEG